MNEIGRHVLLGRGGRRAGTGAAELIGALDLEIGLARLGVGEDADARRIEMPVPGGIIGRIAFGQPIEIEIEIGAARKRRLVEETAPEGDVGTLRSEEHTSELQTLMRIS